MIAADLTLYSNPLSTALASSAAAVDEATNHKPGHGVDNKDGDGKEEDTIAADLTKYDSPMASLDIAHKAKEGQFNKIKNTSSISKSK